MKMEKIRLVGSSSVDLPIIGADASGPFVLKNADGLGPPEVNVRLSRTTLEKATYQGKSSSLRQIILTVGLQPDWNTGQVAGDLRNMLYPLLTPRYGQLLQVQILTTGGVVKAYAQGQISKMEPVMFDKDPSVLITIDCDYPYLLAPTDTVQTPAQTTVNGLRYFAAQNDGNAPSGFILGLTLRAAINGTLILSEDNPLGQKIQVEGINWAAGDKLFLNTKPGERGIFRGPGGGAYVSVLNNLNAQVSTWLQLYNGSNSLFLNTATGFDWDPNILFQHRPAYWGA